MSIKLKAQERNISFDKSMEQYAFVLKPELYSRLTDAKVIDEAAMRSGLAKGVIQGAWDAIASVLKAWATEGHSVAIPGLGSMRFSVRATSVADVNMVDSTLIKTRRIIFAPSTAIKKALSETSFNITCYDRNGNIVKRVTSVDPGEVEEEGKFNVTLLASPSEGGQVNGAGSYDAGTSATISAVAKAGYHFTKWSDGDTNATRTIVVDKAYELTATFVADSGGGGGVDEP